MKLTYTELERLKDEVGPAAAELAYRRREPSGSNFDLLYYRVYERYRDAEVSSTKEVAR